MKRLWWPIPVLLLLTACASRPPAKVDEISTRPSQPKSSQARKSTIIPDYYRVKKGDSLYSIGFRYNIDYRQLAAINNIEAPYVIHPNQRLRLVASKQNTELSSNKVKTRPIVQQPVLTAKKETATPIKTTPPKQTEKKSTQSQPSVTISQQPPKTQPVVNLPKNGDLNWLWPTAGKIRTTFSGSNPARKGISIRGNEGQSVKATESGVVVYSGDGLLGYGELIIIKHNDTFLSAYGHNKKRLVTEGQQVKRGDVIAQLGSSGTNVNNLHFEIRKNGQPVNPLDYVKP
ncbi:lipoprotein NlpD/LppB [Marinicella pacifica]|uniref:Lipoprotein NlpD/LppB n=1 Tax=Marinicella pacifica TaxID=1171543 RepID=A0A917CWC2_9GAMM|nr:peptidoglycan DD-metalloendopeptidase family protein [Marinicella pacifica]GGF99899.1 lipoprotein NlpD/LppB [Marinicella pacifica]